MSVSEDQVVCLCFGVSRRKVNQFIRTQKPTTASQLSECFGAGTGCGWCRKYLQQMWSSESPAAVDLPDADEYASSRREYRKQR